MGGHGGLNILPQKRWNVYNFNNREKVRKDEEAAAKEEQLKREQSRKRDAEFRLNKLRQARGIFDPVGGDKDDDDKRKGFKKMKKEAMLKVVMPEDEKYRLGYGLVGKGVNLPWYMAKKPIEDESNDKSDDEFGVRKEEDGVTEEEENLRSIGDQNPVC
ncbi:hypothetical protein LguiA_021633 [Lonicera macranthoides]